MQLSILIISEDISLEVLLKQYFKNLIVNTSIFLKDSDIIINSQNVEHIHIEINNSPSSWIVKKPASILKVINIIDQAIQILKEDVFEIGPIRFFPLQRLCKYNQEEILLTSKETEIILYLIQHHNKEVDKFTLLNEIWGYSEELSTHTLETHIYKLRNKFQGKHDIILSRDSGYTLAN